MKYHIKVCMKIYIRVCMELHIRFDVYIEFTRGIEIYMKDH